MPTLNGYTRLIAQAFQKCLMLQNSYGTTPITDVYVALSTSLITWESPSTTITEPSGFNYSRVQVPTTSVYWDGPEGVPWETDAKIANKLAVTFPKSTGGPWGTILAFAILDDATLFADSDFLWGGVLETPKTIEDETIAIFQIGDLSITSTNTVVP